MKTKLILLALIIFLLAFFGQVFGQAESPLGDSLADVEKLISSLKVNAIIGEPIRAGNSLIIPFSRIKFGVGAGGSMQAFGGGMGGKAIPAGFLIVEGDEVRIELLPVEEKKPSWFVELLPVLVKILPQIMGGKFPTMPGMPPAAPGAQTVPASPAKPKEPIKPLSLPEVEKLASEGKLTDALAGVESLLAKDPGSAELHALKGGLMGRMAGGGNPLDMMKYGMGAMQEFETALKLDPNNIRARFGRGSGRLMAPEGFGRDYDGAIDDFSFVCEKKPSPEAFYHLGLAYKGKGTVDKAKESFKKALTLKPDYAQAVQALKELE